jgi:hypothetical protein
MLKKEKVVGRDNQASLTKNRVNFFQSKQKKKMDNAQNRDNWNNECNARYDSDVWIATKDIIESFETDTQVGAFAVAGILGETDYADEPELPDSRLSMTHSSQDAASVQIISARVVSDVIVNATPIDDSPVGNEVPSNVSADPKKGSILKFRFLATILLLLLTDVIIPAVIVTRKSPNDSSESAADLILEKLQPLLTNTSFLQLGNPGSNQKMALDWLLNDSNFRAYSIDRQVQRFVMAEFFFSTGSTSWKDRQGWISDDDECTCTKVAIKLNV